MKKHLIFVFSSVVLVVCLFCLHSTIASTENSKPYENMVRVGNFYMDKYEFPNKVGAIPVTNVTWEEAQAFCESVGKRLCTADEWVMACRGPRGLRYPYGPVYDGTKCNSESKVDAPLKIGKTPKACVSGYGIYDLNGNVWEWVGTSLEDGVSVRGGAWSSESCAECALKLWIDAPNIKSDRAGFRCCK